MTDRTVHSVMLLTLAGLAVPALLSACTQREAFPDCPPDVTQVEILNTYADHAAADRHVVSGEAARTLCATAFPYDSLVRHRYPDSALGQRRITVLRFTDARGATVTWWLYGLAGYEAGTAIVLEDGRAFHVPNQGPPAYFAEDAVVVPRAEVPTRP